jgi:hypothetical protein
MNVIIQAGVHISGEAICHETGIEAIFQLNTTRHPRAKAQLSHPQHIQYATAASAARSTKRPLEVLSRSRLLSATSTSSTS